MGILFLATKYSLRLMELLSMQKSLRHIMLVSCVPSLRTVVITMLSGSTLRPSCSRRRTGRIQYTHWHYLVQTIGRLIPASYSQNSHLILHQQPEVIILLQVEEYTNQCILLLSQQNLLFLLKTVNHTLLFADVMLIFGQKLLSKDTHTQQIIKCLTWYVLELQYTMFLQQIVRIFLWHVENGFTINIILCKRYIMVTVIYLQQNKLFILYMSFLTNSSMPIWILHLLRRIYSKRFY